MGYCKAPADRFVPPGQVPAAFPLTVKSTEPILKGTLVSSIQCPENWVHIMIRQDFQGLIAQSVLGTAFPVLSICLAIMLSSSCAIVAQFATR